VIDCLAFSPHPDDAELFCSGLLLKFKSAGKRTAVVDLTLGELSTNGNPELRAREADTASEILELDHRRNLNLEDGNLLNTTDNRYKIIEVLRDLRPKICLLPYWIDRHPDHEASARMVNDALFYSGLQKIETGTEPHRPEQALHYMMHTPFIPGFVVDISEVFEKKMEAIRAYKSQFLQQAGTTHKTYINEGEFLESIELRARYYGQQIGCRYGEPYLTKEVLKVNNILQFFA
jgi:bacillithiol biosynthesis deacetylase BshB1